MPDFSAISALIGGIKNVLDGITSFAGSLAGNNVSNISKLLAGSLD